MKIKKCIQLGILASAAMSSIVFSFPAKFVERFHPEKTIAQIDLSDTDNPNDVIKKLEMAGLTVTEKGSFYIKFLSINKENGYLMFAFINPQKQNTYTRGYWHNDYSFGSHKKSAERKETGPRGFLYGYGKPIIENDPNIEFIIYLDPTI